MASTSGCDMTVLTYSDTCHPIAVRSGSNVVSTYYGMLGFILALVEATYLVWLHLLYCKKELVRPPPVRRI